MVHIFFSGRSTEVMHIFRSWVYTTVIVHMLCQLLPCISNYHCSVLDGKCPSQVFDHHLVIFSFLNKPVEYFPLVVSLETPLFLGYLEDGGRKLIWNFSNYSPVNATMGTTGFEYKIPFLKSHSFHIVVDIRVSTNMMLHIMLRVASPYSPRELS